MSKRSFLFILCALLLSCSLCGNLAEESRTVVWRVTAPVINTEALQTETFGADLSAVQAEQRRNGSILWSIGEDGVPFCGINYNLGAEGIALGI